MLSFQTFWCIWCKNSDFFFSVLWIWIRRIRTFLGLPDPLPYPLVTSMVRLRILPSSSKNSKKNLDFYSTVLCLLYDSLPMFRIHRIRMFSWIHKTEVRIRIRTKMSRIHNHCFLRNIFHKVGWICLNVFCRLLRGRLSAVDVRILADYVRRYNKLGLCSPGDQSGNAKSKCNTLICFLFICKQY